MDVISFSEASTANGRIESFIENPDSTSGIVTVPKVIASGETITIPAGRIAVLPNVQVDGVMNIEGEVFVPSGSTYGDLDTQIALKADTSYVNSKYSGFKNYIINGNFDIWQRGTSQTALGYGSDDRWYNASDGSTKTHSQVACTDTERALFNTINFSRTVVTSVAGAGHYVIKRQSIEDVTKLAGKNITVSFWAKADTTKNIWVEFKQSFGAGGSPSTPVTGLYGQAVPLTSTWQKKTITITLPSIIGKTLGTDGVHTTATELQFWFDVGSTNIARIPTGIQQSGTFDIAQVQLEEGSVATPFENRPIGLELSLCQRYCYIFNNFDALYRINKAVGLTTIPFPVSMRTAPTISSYRLEVDGVQQAVNSGATVIQTNKEGVLFIVGIGTYTDIVDVMYFTVSAEL